MYAISDPGNSRYTGVLPLLKGRALHFSRFDTNLVKRERTVTEREGKKRSEKC